MHKDFAPAGHCLVYELRAHIEVLSEVSAGNVMHIDLEKLKMLRMLRGKSRANRQHMGDAVLVEQELIRRGLVVPEPHAVRNLVQMLKVALALHYLNWKPKI